MATVSVGDEVTPLHIDGVDGQHIKTMAALLRDPNPIHFDTAVTQALGMGDKAVNQGPTNVGYVATALMAWAGGGPSCVRHLKVRLAGNVFADDRLTAGGRVESVEDVDGTPVATCAVWLRRDTDDAVVVTGTARVAV
ncbi:MaoC/PaaZ C-terminal domain-containing protein [Euzebya rosea]|uniref:MaoC/PaaZ C-terminal domain-containing protein n=1 Tax=Euzebya rosea TaxID=2052804 RepID=UPI000D3E5992|nr:MaoC/PaaZ C-terminal domain-containing protein [Euzebya rosea]